MAKDPKKKLSLFFGAGAEVSYGMPSGGRFAIDIFRSEWKEVIDHMKKLCDEINDSYSHSTYAKEWLPTNYKRKRISKFGQQQYKIIIQSSLENKREQILKFLLEFDDNHQIDESTKTAFKNILKLKEQDFEDFCCNKKIVLSQRLTQDYEKDVNQFFQSKYFSLLLGVLLQNQNYAQQSSKHRKLQELVKAFIELLVGACGIELVQNLNEGIFKENPNHSVFNEIGNIFSIDYSNIGMQGLKELLSPHQQSQNIEDIDFILSFAFSLLEKLYEQVFDYQILMDIYFSYLYRPKSDWSKFCMIVTFLHQVQQYIADKRDECLKKNHNQGYYHDLIAAAEHFQISAIATTNYTELISDYYPQGKHLVQYLNGSVDEFYDPYHNQIVAEKNTNDLQYFTVPLLFTQSAVKPLTALTISQRYVDTFNKLKESDIVCAIGFGFNGDDGHINSIFRTLLEESSRNGSRPKVVVMDYQGKNSVKYYCKQMRLQETYDENLLVWSIDEERQVMGKPWYEALGNETSA